MEVRPLPRRPVVDVSEPASARGRDVGWPSSGRPFRRATHPRRARIRDQGVEKADGVVGHVLERVAASRQVRRAACVAVVEPDHAEALGGELPVEVLRPVDQLRAETHDEQHHGSLGVSECVVAEVHVADGRESRRLVPNAIGDAHATASCTSAWSPWSKTLRLLDIEELLAGGSGGGGDAGPRSRAAAGPRGRTSPGRCGKAGTLVRHHALQAVLLPAQQYPVRRHHPR
jgi:hypothetical protein